MKRRCIVEKYKNLDDEDRKAKYDYYDGCQYCGIIRASEEYGFLTLLLYSI